MKHTALTPLPTGEGSPGAPEDECIATNKHVRPKEGLSGKSTHYTHLMTYVQSPELTQAWKERPNFKMYSDLHTHTVTQIHP